MTDAIYEVVRMVLAHDVPWDEAAWELPRGDRRA